MSPMQLRSLADVGREGTAPREQAAWEGVEFQGNEVGKGLRAQRGPWTKAWKRGPAWRTGGCW